MKPFPLFSGLCKDYPPNNLCYMKKTSLSCSCTQEHENGAENYLQEIEVFLHLPLL